MAVAHYAQTDLRDAFERAVRLYVDEVSELEWVQQVFVEGTPPDVPRIWTVISAPEFERKYRDPIYHAEAEALRAAGVHIADFQLVNLSELEGDPAYSIPQAADILLSR